MVGDPPAPQNHQAVPPCGSPISFWNCSQERPCSSSYARKNRVVIPPCCPPGLGQVRALCTQGDKDIVEKLNAAAVEVLADLVAQSRLGKLGFEMFPRDRQTPEALATTQNADVNKWWPIIKEWGIKAE